LFRAIARGDGAGVRALLAAGTPANTAEPETKWPAIMIACLIQEFDAALALLEAGADPSAAKGRWAALSLAWVAGRDALVDALLARGADPDVEAGPERPKLLMAAAMKGEADLV